MKFLSQNISTLVFMSLGLGLAPFVPEPHLFGKVRWVLGGGVGMQTIDYLDLLMHGAPVVLLIVALVLKLKSYVGKEQ